MFEKDQNLPVNMRTNTEADINLGSLDASYVYDERVMIGHAIRDGKDRPSTIIYCTLSSFFSEFDDYGKVGYYEHSFVSGQYFVAYASDFLHLEYMVWTFTYSLCKLHWFLYAFL